MHKTPLINGRPGALSVLSLISLCAGAAAATLTTAQAQEWTRFRGPNGSGIGDAPGLPAEFMVGDYDWMMDLPGTGHSSPVLWGQQLYLTLAGNDEDQTRKVLCLNAGNGEKLWEWAEPFSPHHQHRFNTFASATPAVDADALYLAWSSGGESIALALDHRGELLWQNKYPDFSSDHGNASSPILVDDLVIIQLEEKDKGTSELLGLNRKDGEEAWRYTRPNDPATDAHKSAYSTPILFEGKDGRKQLLCVNTTHGFTSLDPATGKVLWNHNPGYKMRSVGSLTLAGDLVFATMGSGGGGKESAVIRPEDAARTGKAEIAFELPKKGLPYVPTPIACEGLVYLWGDGGVLTCLDEETGEMIYQERVETGTYFSSPVIADGKIYCANQDGKMVAVATGREFKVLGKSQLGAGVNATPAIAHGNMYIRTNDHIICLGGNP